MERVKEYQNIIIQLLEKYIHFKGDNQSDVETEFIADRERNHFLIMNVGWKDKTPVYHTIIHIDIKDGKVWVQQDWTDAVIVDELIENGILQSDIVLGFLAPYKRPYSGFAAA